MVCKKYVRNLIVCPVVRTYDWTEVKPALEILGLTAGKLNIEG
jgi:hypothetical protein